VFDKIATWVERVKQIGDVVAQYDASQMSLPWAGIRLLLQIGVNDVQTFGAMAEGVEFISDLVTRCAIVEELYLQGTSEARTQLDKAIVKLYTVVLQCLLKARRYYNKSTTGSVHSLEVFNCSLLTCSENVWHRASFKLQRWSSRTSSARFQKHITPSVITCD
jgi:hypothetical protein